VTGGNGDGPYLDLDRDAWRGLRASTPMSLTAEGLEAVRGLGDPIKLGEVEDIYLPLSNVLQPAPPGATRARATLVLHKGADHRVTRVRLRRF